MAETETTIEATTEAATEAATVEAESSMKEVTRRLHGVSFKMPLPFASGAEIDALARQILDRTLLSTRLKAIRAKIKEQVGEDGTPDEATVTGLAKWAAANVGLPLPPTQGRTPRTPEEQLEQLKRKLAATLCRQLIEEDGNDPKDYDIQAEVDKLFASIRGAEKHYETQAKIQLGLQAPSFADAVKEMMTKAEPKAETKAEAAKEKESAATQAA